MRHETLQSVGKTLQKVHEISIKDASHSHLIGSVWEPFGKSTGNVATCIRVNPYVYLYSPIQSNRLQ